MAGEIGEADIYTDFSKITIGSHTYNVKDAVARELASNAKCKVHAITESMVTVATDATKGVSPYNTSYGYTNITINDTNFEWVEGDLYIFIVDTKLVVASNNRNVRVRIGTSGTWIPVYLDSSIMAGSSYFTKASQRIFVYKKTYQTSIGALHMMSDSNTTYAYLVNTIAGDATSSPVVIDSAGYGARYSLIFPTTADRSKWSSLVKSSSTGTTKTAPTLTYYLQDPLYIYSANIAAGAKPVNALYQYYQEMDLRYTANTSNTYLVAYDRAFLWLKDYDEATKTFKADAAVGNIVSATKLGTKWGTSITKDIYLYWLGYTTATWYQLNPLMVDAPRVWKYTPGTGTLVPIVDKVFSGSYNDLTDKPTIPAKVSDLTNDSGYITGYTETDPTVPSWAKQPNKPTYTASEVGALPSTTVIPPTVTESTVSGWGFTKNTGTYSKPSGGIPKTDLTTAVQTSLDKADTALQEHQSLANYVQTTDSRLSDARTPKSHTHTKSQITDFPTIPTKLPNPQKLTINGTEYDGSSAVSLTIEGGNQNPKHNWQTPTVRSSSYATLTNGGFFIEGSHVHVQCEFTLGTSGAFVSKAANYIATGFPTPDYSVALSCYVAQKGGCDAMIFTTAGRLYLTPNIALASGDIVRVTGDYYIPSLEPTDTISVRIVNGGSNIDIDLTSLVQSMVNPYEMYTEDIEDIALVFSEQIEEDMTWVIVPGEVTTSNVPWFLIVVLSAAGGDSINYSWCSSTTLYPFIDENGFIKFTNGSNIYSLMSGGSSLVRSTEVINPSTQYSLSLDGGGPV